MSSDDSSQLPSQPAPTGSLSPEEEERARLEREARRAQQATAGQGEAGVPGGMGFAGDGQATATDANRGVDPGYGNDSRDFAARAINELDRSAASTGDAAGGLFHGIGRGLNYVVEKTTNAVSAAGGQAADLTSATVSALGNAGGTISDIAGTVVDSATSGALTLASNAAGAVGSVDLGGVVSAAGSMAGAAAEAAGSVAGGVAGAMGNLPVGEILGAVASGSGDVLGAVAEGAGEVVGGVLGAVLDNL